MAAALHALGLSLMAQRSRVSDAPTPPGRPLATEMSVTLEHRPHAASRPPGPRERAASLPAAAAPRPRLGMARRPASPRGTRDGSGTGDVPTPVEPGARSEPTARVPAPAERSSAAPHGAHRSRPLSLDQLGLGAHNPLWRVEAGELPSADATPRRAASGAHLPRVEPNAEQRRATAEAELERSFVVGALERDQSLGLGPEGPVIQALKRLTYDGATAPNGSARVRVHVESDGRVRRAELSWASSDERAWRDILERLRRALDGVRLRTRRGVTLELDVASREQLPSGAAPGFALSVLGQELISSDRGPNPTRLSILEPLVTTVTLPGGDGLEIPFVGIGLLALMGDPVDIGAAARRVVQVRLDRMIVH